MAILEVFFVRHGLSCANVLGKKKFGHQYFYSDPELSAEGIKISKGLSDKLVERIYERWPARSHTYTVCSSQMMRAQETAFYMLASRFGSIKPINVVPHLGEIGISKDTYSMPQIEQYTILAKRNPAVVRQLIIGKDAREKQDVIHKAHMGKFLVWAKENLDFFHLGDDGIYRTVIFTHGFLLKRVFQLEEHMNNNNAIFTKIDLEKGDFTQIRKDMIYFNLNKSTSLGDCPDKCRITTC
jgi:broad specificity phosphatase PhoE